MDPIQVLRSELRKQVEAVLSGGGRQRKAAEKLEDLCWRYPDCAELALSDAARTFYSKGGPAGVAAMKAVLERSGVLYSVGCLDEIKLASIRRLTRDRASLSARDFSNFIFLFHLSKLNFGRQNELFSWLKLEFAKRSRQRSYSEMFHLRNLLLSLNFIGLDRETYYGKISAEIESFDKKIIQILHDLTRDYVPRKRDGLSKIVICAGLMKHGPATMHARVILEYARNLAKHHPELTILILVTNEIPFRTPAYDNAMGRAAPAFGKRLENLYGEMIPPDLTGRVLFEFLPLYEGDFQDILRPIQRVAEFDPDVMMHYGAKFHNESYFLRRVLFDRVPAAYFFSQMNNRVDPYNDIYLARNSHPLVGVYDKSKVRIAPPPVRPAELSKMTPGEGGGDYPADGIKSSAEEVILITVLGGVRMEKIFRSYSQVARDRMMDLLEREGVKWIWLGPMDADSLLSVDGRFQEMNEKGRLEIRSFEKNLKGLLGHCDIFLHLPNFTGGAGGLSVALMEALPVLCFKNTDAAESVPPEFVFDPDDQAGFFERAVQLIESAEDREAAGRKCAEYYRSADLEALVEASVSGLQDAIRSFNLRLEDAAVRQCGHEEK